jgi:hypothetical protein
LVLKQVLPGVVVLGWVIYALWWTDGGTVSGVGDTGLLSYATPIRVGHWGRRVDTSLAIHYVTCTYR